MTRRTTLACTLSALVAVAGLALPLAAAAEAGAGQAHTSPATQAIKRSMPNGRTDVIKAMGHLKEGKLDL
jgi:hypothetical protein